MNIFRLLIKNSEDICLKMELSANYGEDLTDTKAMKMAVKQTCIGLWVAKAPRANITTFCDYLFNK